jgi:hypothetical protein
MSRRKWTTTTVRDRAAVLAPDLVERDFRAQGPNRLWVADITYVPTWAGFLNVAVVLDAWSRRVVGWAFALHLRAELVLAALEIYSQTSACVKVLRPASAATRSSAMRTSTASSWISSAPDQVASHHGQGQSSLPSHSFDQRIDRFLQSNVDAWILGRHYAPPAPSVTLMKHRGESPTRVISSMKRYAIKTAGR